MREEVKPAVKPVCSGQAVQAGLPSEEDMKEAGVSWGWENLGEPGCLWKSYSFGVDNRTRVTSPNHSLVTKKLRFNRIKLENCF